MNFISLNVHVHNRDVFLDRFLDNLNQQTYRIFELNILETANLDTTISIIKKYCNSFMINCWQLHTKFVDRTKALNFLVKNSNSDVICIADVDVMKDTNYLEEVSTKLSSNSFLVQYIKRLGIRDTHYFNNKQFNFSQIADKVVNIEFNKGGKSQIAIHRENFMKIGGFDERIFGWGYDDSDLYHRFCLSGLTPIEMNSLGIHLHHEPCWEFNGFRNHKTNLEIHQENVKNKVTVIKNEINRTDNQVNPLAVPIKLKLSK